MNEEKSEIVESASYIIWKPVEMIEEEKDRYVTMYDIWCETVIGESGFRIPCVVYQGDNNWHCTLSGATVPQNEFKVLAYSKVPCPVYKVGDEYFSYEGFKYQPENEIPDYSEETLH